MLLCGMAIGINLSQHFIVSRGCRLPGGRKGGAYDREEILYNIRVVQDRVFQI